MEKQEKNCRPDNLYYCGIVLPLAGILFLALLRFCLLYTSDAADEEDSVDLGGRRIIKKKKRKK